MSGDGRKRRILRHGEATTLRLDMAPEAVAKRTKRITGTTKRLRVRVNEWGRFLTGDDRVTAAITAQLIGVTTGTLRNWRYLGIGPTPCRLSPVTYELRELARWLVDEVYQK